MITPLRRRHRWMAPAAFALATVGVGAAVLARPDEFVRDRRAPVSDLLARTGAIAAGLGDPPISALATGTKTGWWLRVTVHEPVDAPDLLAYLVRGPYEGEAVPDGARLAGSVAQHLTTGFTLEADLPDDPHVVLYSLGHGRRVATIRVSLGLDGFGR